jgi:adenine-specific DNA-methyltransferase
MARAKKTASVVREEAQTYQHPTADLAARPEIGTQAHFKKAKPPTTYRYDSSLAPELKWDGQNPAREVAEAILAELQSEVSSFKFQVSSEGQEPETAPRQPETRNSKLEALLRQLETRNSKLEALLRRLQALSGPFLDWCGKAERLSFDVPTLPLFVHERLSTKAILETLKGHKRDKQMDFLDVLFGSPERSLHDQVLRAYEHRDQWVNRLILGDSLVVMNSLLRFESLGGQVQMIYVDPPYGVKFGSNFQPFIRKRDVKHNDDEDFTREPEMVQAYRDTWELGLHSYLTYLRDRLLLARELLHPSGSIFVQISDENLHHVRELMDEVFGSDCFICTIVVKKKGSQKSSLMDPVNDYLLWFGKSPRGEGRTTFKRVFIRRELDLDTLSEFKFVELGDGREFLLSETPDTDNVVRDYRLSPKQLFVDHPDARLFASNPLTSGGERKNQSLPFEFRGKTYSPPRGSCWKTTVQTDDGSEPGMTRLAEAARLLAGEGQLRFKRYLDDFGYIPLSNWWDALGGASEPLYVVQTNTEILQRCILMTTDPGDLVLDPTCGSGTTAFVAERWGRRWITCDASRVPLALARQRLLTATFDYYELKEEKRGPAGGFVYQRKQNSRGEEVGGIVPHITLKSIANNEPPTEEVLVHRPEPITGVVRVSGPFTFEATIPAAEGLDEEPETPGIQSAEHQTHVERMIEVLRRAPVLRLPGNQTITLRQIRPPAKTLALSAEAMMEFQVSSFEFQEEEGRGPLVPRTDRLAEGHDPGRAGVPLDAGLSEGGALRVGEPDAAGGGVGAQQHRGGTGAAPSGRIPSVPRTGTGLPSGTGDTGGIGGATELPGRSGAPGTGAAVPGSAADAERSDLETRNLKLETAPVAILFGPEHGPLSERLVREAWDEAGLKHYQRLLVIGFGIDPKAREFVEKAGQIGIPCVYLQATMDLQMGDLLKNMRSSQVFSVCGLPDVKIVSSCEFPVSSAQKSRKGSRSKPETRNSKLYQVELLGLDTFDPATMEPDHVAGSGVPAWFLDTNYNGLVFRVCQAFFPRTGAWENLKKALRIEFEDTVWEHLAGTVSAPFAAGEHGQVAVKVIDPRGNELLVVKKLEAER